MIYALMLDKVEEKGFSEFYLCITVVVVFVLVMMATYVTTNEISSPPKPYEKQAWLDMICAQDDGMPLRVPYRTGEAWGDNRGISYGRRIHADYYASTWRGEEGSPWRGIVFEPRNFGVEALEYSTTCGA